MLSSLTLFDRRISLAEISQLEFKADLVVLRGCETGQGLLAGSDSISLASGFLGAGARSLMVSLWQVEDTATAAFMNEFYQKYFASGDGSFALTGAQRRLLERGRQAEGAVALYQHPAYWAPFILFGRG